MSGYDLYVFILCLIVFTLLTGLFSVLLHYVIKMTLQAIEHGLEDVRITKEYRQMQRKGCLSDVLSRVISAVLIVCLLVAFVLTIYIHMVDNKVPGKLSVPKVVMSESMAYQNANNIYIEENALTDQVDMFDLIFVEKLPDEFELELYDIVAYDYYGELIIHRIVDIEEPNEDHPNHRHFLLRGDAVAYDDEYPVLYEQMRAIYRGQRIKFVGSFFVFMRSPAGNLCVLLVLFAILATPVAEKKLQRAKEERLKKIGVIKAEEESTGKEMTVDQ